VNKQENRYRFLDNGGNTGRRIRDFDWSQHPIGPIDGWEPVLRTGLGIALSSSFPCFLLWGEDLALFYNDAYIPILGQKQDSLGRSFFSVWPEVAESLGPTMRRVLDGESFFFENYATTLERHGYPEQTWFTFSYSPLRDEPGAVRGVICTCIEVTDKMQALARHKEAEERLALSLEASGNIGTWSVDLEDGTTHVDERFARLFQVDAALARSGTELARFTDMIHPEDRPRVLAAIETAMRDDTRYDIEYRIPQLSGVDVWVNARGKVFADPVSGRRRFAGVAVDISARVATERALGESEQKFRSMAEELRAASLRKDEFLAMLAHELRNPLAPISNAAQLLTMAGASEQRVRQSSEVIIRQVRHMTALVDDLLDVSRVTRGQVTLEREPVEMGAVVAGAVEQARPLIEARGHRFEIDMGGAAARILGDRTRLVQVVANLLNNAAKYTPQGGRIALAVARQGGTVSVTVSDNGIGIDSAMLPHLFDLFSQAERTPDRAQGGLGLGLALVKSLVQLHGGRVEAHSAGLGRGSSFSVIFDLAPDGQDRMPQTGADARRADAGRLPGGRRVLVVDDNVDAAQSLGEVLGALGHAVRTTHSPAAALTLAEADWPEVFILDIGLPDIDGYELARRLRALQGGRPTRYVALTGYGQAHDKVLARGAGFDHHFVKPVDLEALCAVLDRD
jgi:PAS domain S-box-containing protein